MKGTISRPQLATVTLEMNEHEAAFIRNVLVYYASDFDLYRIATTRLAKQIPVDDSIDWKIENIGL